MFFNFFKTPTVRKFEHKNIYWDPEKEKREERRERARQQIENETGNKNMAPHSTLRRGFLSEEQHERSAERSARSIRLAVYCAVLVALAIWMAK